MLLLKESSIDEWKVNIIKMFIVVGMMIYDKLKSRILNEHEKQDALRLQDDWKKNGFKGTTINKAKICLKGYTRYKGFKFMMKKLSIRTASTTGQQITQPAYSIATSRKPKDMGKSQHFYMPYHRI